MRKFGYELEFISWIKRDGSGVVDVTKEHIENMRNDNFNISRLSVSNQTFIASGFNSFVVKIK